MQQVELVLEEKSEQTHLEVPTLNFSETSGETLAEISHDARNMVAALMLYCDLLEEPGVLATDFRHYGSELKLITAACRRIVEKLAALDSASAGRAAYNAAAVPVELPLTMDQAGMSEDAHSWNRVPAVLVKDFAWELQSNRNLLAALAGPSVAVSMDIGGGDVPVNLSSEDLTRILVNLVKNSAEAMEHGGRIQFILRELLTAPDEAPWVVLNVEDNGPGIPADVREKIFDSGYTTRTNEDNQNGAWGAEHRGLGLAITRSIVEAAGGTIHAANRDPKGLCFQIELPVRNG